MTNDTPITPDMLTVPRKIPEYDAGRVNIVGLTREALKAELARIGTPEKQLKMRLNQVWQWVYQWGKRDFQRDDQPLQRRFRAELEAHFVIEVPEVVTKQVSEDGTRKYLVKIAGGHEVEVVYIPETNRGTLCISSQVGCTLTCTFCHTGTQKLVRNLTAGEIIGQVMVARDDLDEWPEPGASTADAPPRLLSNIVLMGMGEPLYNFNNVRDAMKIAMDGEGIALSRRRITLSTSWGRARDCQDGGRNRLSLGGEFSCHHRRGARCAGADQQALEHRDTASNAARVSQALKFRADHL